MNFKPTVLKSIISLIIGLIVLRKTSLMVYPCGEGCIDTATRFLLWQEILFFVISALLIYTIWSLIQKKK
ncbi:MAG: hypothetical protein AABX11_04355 [Nanoarchaeota archaeon]